MRQQPKYNALSLSLLFFVSHPIYNKDFSSLFLSPCNKDLYLCLSISVLFLWHLQEGLVFPLSLYLSKFFLSIDLARTCETNM